MTQLDEHKGLNKSMVLEKDASLEEMKIREVQLKNVNKVCYFMINLPGAQGRSEEALQDFDWCLSGS
jgi:hypothetical protein